MEIAFVLISEVNHFPETFNTFSEVLGGFVKRSSTVYLLPTIAH